MGRATLFLRLIGARSSQRDQADARRIVIANALQTARKHAPNRALLQP